MKRNILLTILAAGLLLGGCKKFVEIETPVNQVGSDQVFTSDASATGAVTALYVYYYMYGSGSSPANSTIVALHNLGAMAADDYYYLGGSYDQYKSNTIPVSDGYNASLWTYAYGVIYEANAIIEGLTASSSLTSSVKNQLMGEAKFIRAFMYFNMVNFYGGVPLVTSTSLTANLSLPRVSREEVYKLIMSDLQEAQGLLTNTYPSVMETRANKQVVTALLSRVYLYLGDWTNAEAQASQVITSGSFKLEPVLNNVFINTSKEIIWQIPTRLGYNWFANTFIPSSNIPQFVLYDTMADAFETGDLRKTAWTSSIAYSGKTYYYPYKYKLRTATAGNEFIVMQRLAEQYLIRAEARAQLNNLPDAIGDLDSVRVRAGLPLLNSALDKPAVLLAVEQERKVELFSEMAHRWMDLKRTNRSTAVLGAIKSTWLPTDTLFPIPLTQIQSNSNLKQNDGYN
jgi:starch-binding outer membrane protein, SusD/RagB family